MGGWKLDATPKPFGSFAILDGGYAIPQRFELVASSEEMRVELTVEVADGKARTAKVTLATDAPGGVSAKMLRSVPIRDVVGDGVQMLLARVVVDGETARFEPVLPTWGEDEALATKRLVGYIDPRSDAPKEARR